MNFKVEVHRVQCWIHQIGDLCLRLLWHFVHLLVSLWYAGVGIVQGTESYLISRGLWDCYKSLDVGKIQYLAIVIESEDACQYSKVFQLLLWLKAIGVKHLCIYDSEGVLKKSKKFIIQRLNNAVDIEEAVQKNLPSEDKQMTLEFVSASDGKEAVAKAANLLLTKYTNLVSSNAGHEEAITETHVNEALRDLGYIGPEPDLLLVYAPVRCYLGFPAWRIRYTEIVHMGPLKSMRYGSLIKAIHKFTTVRQNYGK
ncbi:uncharacterized protein LOC126683172 isoform X2 [Mercurialis annua]|nr:uncharacterized protein LOC126683172 isoform X2 [Mercurialis annua]